ncbi:hypothetical protein QBC41DRAFT_375134 [Cercophora samala]|uniref:DUF7770 domain-containing protein n=1 Tax=Cercophora samala TaxID=330535 RepID=A0AA40D9E7_9PEZI|nr:hypothetical protein QBC41DRAFT_375134 [Cercophora samala]
MDSVDALDDRELADRIGQARMAPSRAAITYSNAMPLADLYFTKTYDKDHLDDVVCAITRARNLGIRTPSVKRVVPILNSSRVECITHRIHGPTLEECWPSLGWFTTVRLAFQLRSMVGRMRTVTSPTAGSLGTGICRSLWLEETYGVPPNASPAVLSSIVNFWYNLVNFRREATKSAEQHKEACADPTKPEPDMVFTHGDLAPRNIILEEKTNNLWLIDWDYSGYYPRYFEFAGIRNFTAPPEWGWFGELRWKFFCWIATGWYEKERAMLRESPHKSILGQTFSFSPPTPLPPTFTTSADTLPSTPSAMSDLTSLAAQSSAALEDLGDNWDLSNLSLSSLTAPVTAIHLCCLRNDLNEGDENGEPPTNHWVLSLQTSHSPDSSIMLDMAPGYGTDGLRGKIEVTSLPEAAYTDETLHAFFYKPEIDVRVEDIARLINDKGRDAFNFSPEWEGSVSYQSPNTTHINMDEYIPIVPAIIVAPAVGVALWAICYKCILSCRPRTEKTPPLFQPATGLFSVKQAPLLPRT